MMRQMIVHSVSPQMPDCNGDISTTFNMMLIMHSTRTTSMLTLPGNDSGGMRKLSQLMATIIMHGIYVCTTCIDRFLKMIKNTVLNTKINAT